MNATLAILALCSAPAASAQDLVPKAGPQTRPVVLRGATLHTVTGGVVEDGTLAFDQGEIVHVGRGEPVGLSGDPMVLELAGKHVYPGFVCLGTVIGLAEVGMVDMSLDHDEAGAFTPEVHAAAAVNPDSWVIPVTRRNGVLTCGVLPQGGRVPGRAAVLRMDGWTWEDMTLLSDAGLVVNWPRLPAVTGADEEADRRAEEALVQLDEFFDAAEAYLAAKRADEALATDLRLEAMASVLEGGRPLFVQASSLRQIESAVLWSAERGLPVVLVGGRDAGLAADLLARHDVPVAVTAAHRMPHRRDLSFASTYELPALLEEAGVRWCLTFSAAPWTTSNARNLPYEAAACIPYGLPRGAALRSVTQAPAELLGVGDLVGSLEVGKLATLFVADGDPFELSTTIELAFIDGRRIALGDKQTALYEKYREKYRQLGLLR